MTRPRYTRRQLLVLGLQHLTERWDSHAWDGTRVLGVKVPYAPEWGVIGVVCRLLRAHVVTDDHCGKPEHRLCVACNQPTPNAEVTRW